jgi:cysteine desulfurase
MADLNKENFAYLDNGDSTQVLPEVVEAMLPFFTSSYGNSASLHKLGLEAEEALDDARESIAKSLGAKPKEIIFTSSATESNNIALEGLRQLHPDKKHVVISPIEHSSVRNIVQHWVKKGYVEVTELEVDNEGIINPDSLRKALRDDTLLVSIIHGNNEIGTIQDLNKLGAICRGKGVFFHSDCAQTLGKIPIDLENTPIDLASFNAHKLHGPKGVGALYMRKKVKVRRIFEGGPQEANVRPGTENIPAIVGFAKAVEIAVRDMEVEMARVNSLTKQLTAGLSEIEHVQINGPTIGSEKRLPGNLNITYKYIEGEAILMSLNYDGVHVSSGSACSSRSLVPSHVLTSIGLLHEEAHGSIRYTLSRLNSEADVLKAIESTKMVVDRLRAMTAFIPELHSKRDNENAATFYKEKPNK